MGVNIQIKVVCIILQRFAWLPYKLLRQNINELFDVIWPKFNQFSNAYKNYSFEAKNTKLTEMIANVFSFLKSTFYWGEMARF